MAITYNIYGQTAKHLSSVAFTCVIAGRAGCASKCVGVAALINCAIRATCCCTHTHTHTHSNYIYAVLAVVRRIEGFATNQHFGRLIKEEIMARTHGQIDMRDQDCTRLAAYFCYSIMQQICQTFAFWPWQQTHTQTASCQTFALVIRVRVCLCLCVCCLVFSLCQTARHLPRANVFACK